VVVIYAVVDYDNVDGAVKSTVNSTAVAVAVASATASAHAPNQQHGTAPRYNPSHHAAGCTTHGYA